MATLTKAQLLFLSDLAASGFTEHAVNLRTAQKNKCGWALVNLGFAEFGWGPSGSFLKTQGFLLTDAGRAVLEEG